MSLLWNFGHLSLPFELDLNLEQSPDPLILKFVAGNDLTLFCNKCDVKIDVSCMKRKEAV